MPTIMDLYNTGLAAREQQTRNKYLDPALAAQTSIAQTQAQFLPEQYRLANQYQGLINQYYGPNITSQINERNVNAKYKPLEVGISLQNSLRNSSRFGDAANVVRSINSMNSTDQAVYLSDPANLQAYTTALKQIQQGVTNGTPSNQVLTPDFMRRFGFNVGGGGGGGGLAANPAMPQQPVAQPEPQQMPVQQPPMGMATPIAPVQAEQQPPPEAAPNTATIPGVGAVQMPPAQQPAGMATPVVQLLPQQAPAEVHPAVQQAVQQHIAENAPNQELSMQDRMLLARQSVANQKLVGAKPWNRAQAAIPLEKYLQDNQPVFAERLRNAAKYAGTEGAVRLAKDKLLAKTPQSLIDYNWVVNDFVPNLGNNVRLMEGLAATNEQRHVLNQMQLSALNWYNDPEAAIKSLNMNMDLFHRQAKAILDAAQPMFPGVLEKLNKIKEPSGGYIKQDIKKVSTADLMKMYKEATNG